MSRWLVLMILVLTGCARVQTLPSPEIDETPAQPAPVRDAGVYHKVGPGETIWRIAKTYGVALDAVIKSNNIPNAALVEQGQLLFIPGADEVIDVPVVKETAVADDDEFIWPFQGKIISFFGESRGESKTQGIDIRAGDEGDVVAARTGQVVFKDYLAGYGHTMILDHGDGFFSVYGNAIQIFFDVGDKVKRGQNIAKAGFRNGAATLHFQIRKSDQADNPLFYLP